LINNILTFTGLRSAPAVACGVVAGTQQLYLDHSLLSGNIAEAANGKGRGGGGASGYEIQTHFSTITGNQAIGIAGGSNFGAGGGLYGTGQNYAFIGNSTIDHNQADIAGGVYLSGSGTAVISDSTISSNQASMGAGGVDASIALTLSHSTISSNQASMGAGGVDAPIALTLAQSTIAFNTAGSLGAGGMFVNGNTDLESSIIANNSPSGTSGGADLGAGAGVSITGGFNLIKVSSVPVPGDTIPADPKLAPLACNGGATRTHALQSGSPAIDTGGPAGGLLYDQRGNSFPRDVGAAPDIGAYESDPHRIFTEGFDC
jgi:hypothetical protein